MSRQRAISFLTLFGLLLSFASSPSLGRPSKENRPSLPSPAVGEVDFTQDIQPMLVEKCLQCHGETKAMGGLRLHTRADLLRGGDKGPVVEPGNSAGSRLIHMVGGLDELKMPLQGEALTDSQVGLLRSWIDRGLEWPGGDGESAGRSSKPRSEHWSFQTIQRPRVPQVQRSDWVRNPIDAFVLRRLEQEGIEPSAEADQTTLNRRLSLDLLGLPPTPTPGSESENGFGPYAYEGRVNRLLASPHFGERWGRKWLDLARYADSDGFEKDNIRLHAWRYRDWVINAFNRDLPYDQFLVEQLAGDLLPDASTEQRVATGFHRNTLTNTEGGVDQEEYRIEQCNASMYSWASMIPVDGDSSAPAHRTAGSNSLTRSGVRYSRSSTPLPRARSRSFSSAGSCAASVATVSLPMRAWGTPRSSQKRYSACFPCTQTRALRLSFS